jgi:cyclopropane fatty-acyl-phospholipid synthase-like methyltransferase
MLCAVCLGVQAEDQKHDAPASSAEFPPALISYQGRTIARSMHYLGAPWLVRESREREEDCETMLRELRLKPGMQVCDMGCGNGYYTLRLARLVGPTGIVWAVDIQQEMLRLLEQRLTEAQIDNVRLRLGSPIDPQLGAAELDLILCVDVYHEFSHPEHMLWAMRRALKPGGKLVLVEFRAEDPAVPIKRLHKMSREQVRRELLPQGLVPYREFQGLPWQHMLFFRAAGVNSRRPIPGRP